MATIREPRRVTFRHYRVLGPRSESAVVVMRFEPAETFSFASNVRWPAGEHSPLYHECLIDGLLDELLARDIEPFVTGIHVVLDAIEFNAIESSPHAFYLAARGAVREALGIGDKSNIQYSF